MKSKTLLKYISSKPLAILPDYLTIITSALEEWEEGALLKVEIPVDDDADASIVDGIKVLSYSGTIMKKTSGLQALSGGISTLQVRKDIESALLDEGIKGIVLSLDSPGGSVDGTKELSDFVLAAKEVKPIVGYADGLMASAAYWIGASCDAIVAYDTTQVGSIGVIMTHFDYSEQDKEAGVKATILKAGKYKSVGNQYEPLSDSDKEIIQDDLDYYYSMFVDHVAMARNSDAKTVIDKMAEGRIFIGSKAKEAGLIDKVGGIEDAINLTLELGGIKVKKEVKEALAAENLTELFTALASRADLPESVATAVSSVITPVAKVEVVEDEYNGLKTAFKAATTANSELQETVKTLKAEVSELKKVSADDTKKAEITALFADSSYVPDETLMAELMEMTPDAAKLVATSLITLQGNTDKVADKLLEDLKGSSEDADVPISRDMALAQIQDANPELELEAAIDLAAKTYPEFFIRT